MAKTQIATPTTAQSLGALLKSAGAKMRKNKGLNGNLSRLPIVSGGSGFTGLEGVAFVLWSWGFTPSFHITGFQPANLSGLKALNVTAWAEASLASVGPGQPPAQTSLAL